MPRLSRGPRPVADRAAVPARPVPGYRPGRRPATRRRRRPDWWRSRWRETDRRGRRASWCGAAHDRRLPPTRRGPGATLNLFADRGVLLLTGAPGPGGRAPGALVAASAPGSSRPGRRRRPSCGSAGRAGASSSFAGRGPARGALARVGRRAGRRVSRWSLRRRRRSRRSWRRASAAARRSCCGRGPAPSELEGEAERAARPGDVAGAAHHRGPRAARRGRPPRDRDGGAGRGRPGRRHPQQALRTIADLGRTALDELDSLVVHLRDPEAPLTVTAPPRLLDIDELLAEPLRRPGSRSRRLGDDLALDDARRAHRLPDRAGGADQRHPPRRRPARVGRAGAPRRRRPAPGQRRRRRPARRARPRAPGCWASRSGWPRAAAASSSAGRPGGGTILDVTPAGGRSP